MIYLQSVERKAKLPLGDGYPFDLPFVRHLDEVAFRSPVTFFVGENGSGKSTLLDAIAAGVDAITVGGIDVGKDPTLAPIRELAKRLTLVWARRSHRGFFLRAQDFFNFGARTKQLIKELDETAAGFEQTLTGYGLQLAQGSVRGQRAALVAKYGEDPNARSHGESFLQLFQARFVPGGLYLLDEPDTALSPQRQLALLAMLKDMVAQEAQFIIATHSPILLAYPDATILAFDGETIRQTPYDAVENVTLTRQFLANPAAYVRRL
jgi:predicted ATPase